MAVNIHTKEQWNTVFDELDPSVPVVTKCGAEWCGPCKALAPKYEALAKKYQGRAAFLEVDIEELAEVADKFEVSSLPTILIFHFGKEVKRTVGAGASVIGEVENSLNSLL